jgi:hypothetical protein
LLAIVKEIGKDSEKAIASQDTSMIARRNQIFYKNENEKNRIF